MAVQATKFEALGRTWTFKFGMGAICGLEALYPGQAFGEIIEDMCPGLFDIVARGALEEIEAAQARLKYSHLRDLLKAAITEGPTTEQVDDIVDEVGTERLLQLVFGATENDISGGSGPKKAAAPA